MWLARVPIPQCPVYVVHQLLWGYFDVPDGEPRPFVYRVENDHIVLLSRLKPRCDARRVSLEAGRVYQFDTLVSPVNGCSASAHAKRAARREGTAAARAYGPRVITSNDQRRAWLERRFEGADVTFATFFDRENLHFRRPGGEFVTVYRCIARGTLYVRDRQAFTAALLRGPGKAKAWGCGLVYLPEVMA